MRVEHTVGESDTNAHLRAKLKVFDFENSQFSGDLIFDKKLFFPDKQELLFFEKKNVCFFEKKCFFWKCFFEKFFFQNFQNFSAHKKLSKIFLNFFKKTHFQKTIFFFHKK